MLTMFNDKKRRREEPEKPKLSDHIVELVNATYGRPGRVIKRMRWALENKSLNLRCLELTKKDVVTFVVPFLKESPNVTEVDVSSNQMEDATAEPLLEVSSIRELNLSVNFITDGLMPALSKNKSIKILNLFSNNITDNGALLLAQNKTLRTLDVGSNKIGLLGYTALSGNISLEVLGIKFNAKIEPSHIATFLNNENLGSLSIGDCCPADESIIEGLFGVKTNRDRQYQARKAAFLMGTDPKLGKNSAIHYAFSKSVIFDKNLIDEIFKFLRPKPFKFRY